MVGKLFRSWYSVTRSSQSSKRTDWTWSIGTEEVLNTATGTYRERSTVTGSPTSDPSGSWAAATCV